MELFVCMCSETNKTLSADMPGAGSAKGSHPLRRRLDPKTDGRVRGRGFHACRAVGIFRQHAQVSCGRRESAASQGRQPARPQSPAEGR
jgi:hypothetical protein